MSVCSSTKSRVRAAKDYAEAGGGMRERKRGGRGKARIRGRDTRGESIFPRSCLSHSSIRGIMRLYYAKLARGKPCESSL